MENRSLPDISLPVELSRSAGAALLKLALIRGLAEDATDWNEADPPLSAEMRTELKTGQIQTLLAANVIRSERMRLIWNFRPFYGNGLVLFRDLEAYRFCREFVWLHTETASGSWDLPESVPVRYGKRVLDLGCGSGLNALRIAARGARSIGVDINPRAVAVANFNRALNCLDTARFVHSDWNSFLRTDYDLLISQPPFDPVLPGGNPAYAFGGGGDFGLEFSLDLIGRFQPSKGYQSMQLYVHSFVEGGVSLLERRLRGVLAPLNSHLTAVRKTHTMESWWAKYKDRHNLELNRPMPKEWRHFEGVQACFVTIAAASELAWNDYERRAAV